MNIWLRRLRARQMSICSSRVRHAAAFRAVAGRLGIKALIPPADGRHPATEHYLGLDDATGRLFHVHVQYLLVLGERYAKNYILPLEHAFLDGVTLDRHDAGPAGRS